jgi:hypothetical protein
LSQSITQDTLFTKIAEMEARIARLERSLAKAQQTLLNVQSKNGASETYYGTIGSPLDSGGGGPMRITYTPPVDAWWDVSGFIGIVNKVDAAYNYIYGGLLISPQDEDGVVESLRLVMQHSQVNTFEWREASRLFKLKAGISYSVDLYLGGNDGGVWQYYRGPNHLHLSAKAFSR